MKPLHSLLLACLLALSVLRSSAIHFAPTPTPAALAPRQTLPLFPGPGQATTGASAATSASAPASETSEQTSSSSQTTSSSTTTQSTSSAQDTSSSSQSSQNTSPTSPPSQNTTPPPAASSPPPQQTSVQEFTTTGEDGQVSTLTVTSTNTPSGSSTSSSTPSNTPNPSGDDGKLGVGSIVGMSVAGGVAVLGIVGFFVWKFTRKRFTDFDDNEAIKWPELNAHSGPSDATAMPARDTTRGFDSEGDLSRFNSTNYSTPEFSSNDPYAVPPLPHMNPNQPYRDDPTGASGYYDPYRGPIPGTLENGSSVDHEWTGGEAIAMTQMNAGRMSPGPHAAMRTMSPGPQAAYAGEYDAGRRSPGPQAALGAGRASPGPQTAYGGRQSPGPYAAYDNYGPGAR